MSDTYLTRKTLLKRLKTSNDDMAWEEFVRFYKGFIYSIIMKMRVNHADQDDLSQKVMVKIWKSLDQFDHNQQKGHFRSWLSSITKNTVLSFIRDSNRANNKNESFKQEVVKDFDEPEIDNMIEEEWEKHISDLAFDTIKNKVSPQAMEAFLAGLRGEAGSETAAKLNSTEDMVYTYRSRVKLKLIAEIKNLRELLE